MTQPTPVFLFRAKGLDEDEFYVVTQELYDELVHVSDDPLDEFEFIISAEKDPETDEYDYEVAEGVLALAFSTSELQEVLSENNYRVIETTEFKKD